MSQKKNSKPERVSATAEGQTQGRAAMLWACSKATGKCLNPHCDRMCTVTRGLCQNCYNLAREHVKAGRTTWEAMEQSGKCRRPMIVRQQMGPRRAWFLTGGPGA